MRRAYLGFILSAACAATAVPAAGQTMSDSFNFIKAVRSGDGTTVQSLIGAPGSTVTRSRDGNSGETALHIVIRRRDVAWTGFLVDKGVDPEISDKSGDTALGLAARLGFTEGVRALLAGGAKVDGKNGRGETPLIIAVQNYHIPVVQLLARQGASSSATDNVGLSARDYAARDRRAAPMLRILDARRAAPAAKPRP